MIPAVRALVALALCTAAMPAGAFTRETTGTGLCVWSRDRQMTYALNAGAVTATPCSGAALAEATAAGLAAWNGAGGCTDFSFVRGQSTTETRIGNDGLNLVVFRTRLCSEIPCSGPPGFCARTQNCWENGIGTIGFTTTTSDQATGEILDADMELFAWDGAAPPFAFGFYFTCEASAPDCSGSLDDWYLSTPTGCNGTDVQAVVTHEAGHMLGLGHVPSGAVMAPTVGRVTQRALQADDVSGVCTIYPAGRSALTCLPGGGVPSPDSGGGGGCSSAGGGVAGLLVAALVASRALRRRR